MTQYKSNEGILKMQEYKLILNFNAASFSREVNEHIRDGWVLYHGPSIAVDEDNIYYIQAMIRTK